MVIVKRLCNKLYNRLNSLKKPITHKYQTVKLGNPDYGSFDINTDALTHNSIVYSVGIGEDVSFDAEIMGRFKCGVYAFDATPRAIEYVKNNVTENLFHFYPFGIADFDGNEIWYMQANPGYVSCSSIRSASYITATKPIMVQVKSLSTVMKELGHNHIDLLKMDIEGSEYKVIADILRKKIDVTQITLEFHHRYIRWGYLKTNRIIKKLYHRGYELIFCNSDCEECTFLKMN